MTTMLTSWGVAAESVRLARQGVPPESLPEDAEESPAGPHSPTLRLTAAETEVMICFALSSPLHYGPVENDLCKKLRRHLRGLYARGMAPVPISDGTIF
jgi:hypothetical protein